MSIPFGVSHNKVAQTDFGIAARDEISGEIFPNALAVISFGLLFGNFWALCDDDETTVWTPKAAETTTWTPVAAATTTWSEC